MKRRRIIKEHLEDILFCIGLIVAVAIVGALAYLHFHPDVY